MYLVGLVGLKACRLVSSRPSRPSQACRRVSSRPSRLEGL